MRSCEGKRDAAGQAELRNEITVIRLVEGSRRDNNKGRVAENLYQFLVRMPHPFLGDDAIPGEFFFTAGNPWELSVVVPAKCSSRVTHCLAEQFAPALAPDVPNNDPRFGLQHGL